MFTVSQSPPCRKARRRPSAASSGNVDDQWSPWSGNRSIASSERTYAPQLTQNAHWPALAKPVGPGRRRPRRRGRTATSGLRDRDRSERAAGPVSRQQAREVDVSELVAVPSENVPGPSTEGCGELDRACFVAAYCWRRCPGVTRSPARAVRCATLRRAWCTAFGMPSTPAATDNPPRDTRDGRTARINAPTHFQSPITSDLLRIGPEVVRDHGVISGELLREAEAHGVATSYRDWHRRRAEVGEEPCAPCWPPWARRRAERRRRGPPPLAACLSRPGRRRCRPGGAGGSRSSCTHCVPPPWGHGDLRDLAELAAWSARELGAGFVLINPLHAAGPVPAGEPVPYLPMSRRFISPLYLRVEDIPEYARLPAAHGHIDGTGCPAARRQRRRPDRPGCGLAGQRRPGDHLPPAAGPGRRAAFSGCASTRASRWMTGPPGARSGEMQADWRGWPQPLRSIRSAAVGAELARLRSRAPVPRLAAMDRR